MKTKIAVVMLLLAAAGCQRTSQPRPQVQPPAPPPPVVAPPQSNEPLVWGRRDCKRASTSPEVQTDFARDKPYCEERAGVREGDAVNATMVSCMNSRGYNYRTRGEHDAACARTPQRSAAR